MFLDLFLFGRKLLVGRCSSLLISRPPGVSTDPHSAGLHVLESNSHFPSQQCIATHRTPPLNLVQLSHQNWTSSNPSHLSRRSNTVEWPWLKDAQMRTPLPLPCL